MCICMDLQFWSPSRAQPCPAWETELVPAIKDRCEMWRVGARSGAGRLSSHTFKRIARGLLSGKLHYRFLDNVCAVSPFVAVKSTCQHPAGS